jgi:hypothetical protein
MFVPRNKNLVRFATLLFGVALSTSMSVGALPRAALASPVTAEKLIALTNEARRANGLEVLTVSALLTASAQAKSNDMAEKSYFAHTSPEGVTPWEWFKRVGYDYIYAGENLAKNFASAEEMFDAWMASSTHRANVLSSHYREIGIAMAVNGSSLYATQHFGRRAQSPAATGGTGGIQTPPTAVVAVRDTTPPAFPAIDHQYGVVNQGDTVTFSLEVAGDPAAVWVTIGSKAQPLLLTDGRWVGEVTLYAGGEYTVTATAKDLAGNTAVATLGSVSVELPEIAHEDEATPTLVAAYWKEVAVGEAWPITLSLLVIAGLAVGFEVTAHRTKRLAQLVAPYLLRVAS